MIYDVRWVTAPYTRRWANEVAVTREDVDTLKNDWLTDNVRAVLTSLLTSNVILQTIAFWEEYDSLSRM